MSDRRKSDENSKIWQECYSEGLYENRRVSGILDRRQPNAADRPQANAEATKSRDSHNAGSPGAGESAAPIRERIIQYLRQLAPHQKEREAASLLREASLLLLDYETGHAADKEEIARLTAELESLQKDAAREREFICKSCGIRQELGIKKPAEF